jgi:anti-sigma B factor antagonist
MSEESAAKSIAVEKIGQVIVGRLPIKMLEEDDLKTLAGLIDQASAADPSITTVVLDFEQVAMIPSLGLGLLVQIANKCKVRRQRLRLAAVRPQVRQVFSITKLDRIFQFSDTVASATQAETPGP